MRTRCFIRLASVFILFLLLIIQPYYQPIIDAGYLKPALAVHEKVQEDRFSISAGVHHTCAIRNGSLFCWGWNDEGQVGDNTVVTRTVPTPVLGMTKGTTVVAAGGKHTCAIKDRALFCWGWNLDGQLGNGTNISSKQPVTVSNMGNGVTNVAAGWAHTCAIKSGKLFCWGSNVFGKLGEGTYFPRNSPFPVSNMNSGVTAVATGVDHTCAIKSGALYCWGRNESGQLGIGTISHNVFYPTQVMSMTSNVTFVAAGGSHTCAIKGGELYCWGWNDYSQIGDGTMISRSVPTRIAILSGNTTIIATGAYHTCALQDGDIYCWGTNTHGQLGNGTTQSNPSPVTIPSPSTANLLALAAGQEHTIGLWSDYCLYSWGLNSHGQLGDGTQTSRSSPAAVLLGCTWNPLELRAFLPFVYQPFSLSIAVSPESASSPTVNSDDK